MKRIALALFAVVSMSVPSAFAEIVRFDKVTEGIYRGGQPETAEDYQKLKALGIKTIINLRNEEVDVLAEQQVAAQLGLEFKSYPMSVFDYPSEESVDGALADLTNPALQPVFIHCHQGKDRTGLVIGLYRVNFEKWTQEAAWNEMVSFGFVKYLVNLSSYFYLHTSQLASEIGNWF